MGTFPVETSIDNNQRDFVSELNIGDDTNTIVYSPYSTGSTGIGAQAAPDLAIGRPPCVSMPSIVAFCR
ncbi:hypothetical protein [Burkholderia catarinensis]|uniref:hypothetical protein n=1 Tax=Burkholderia catarinensis TaxID=1108140 RepID=UPI001301738F|nr:hypothetical protein [Burkholderia catarinensis]